MMRTGADRKRKAKSLLDLLQVPVVMLLLRCKHLDKLDRQTADDTCMYEMQAKTAGTLVAQS